MLARTNETSARPTRSRLTGVLAAVALLTATGCTALTADGISRAAEGPDAVLEALAGSTADLLDGASSRVLAPLEPRDRPAHATPVPAVRDDVDHGQPRLRPRPRPGPFGMDISSPRQFVSQATAYWCVAAAMQTMMNIIDGGQPRRGTARQRRIYLLGRALSTQKRLGRIGIRPEGWARGLNDLGYGPYVVHAAPSRQAAVRTAARALRMTGKPVGLVTWRGAHSWVMHGFEATADPAYTDRFQVKSVRTHDVWYPRISSIWGASRAPDALVPAPALAEDFLAFRRPGRRYPKWDGRYLLILPLTAEEAQARRG